MNPETCDSLKERMVDVLYHEATPAEQAELETHLATCGSCQEELEGLRQVRAQLRSAPPQVEPAAAPKVVFLGGTGRSGWSRWAGLAAAAAIAALGVLALFRADVELRTDGISISFAQESGTAEPEALRRELLDAIEAYREEDLQDRDLMVASFQEELRQRDHRRTRDNDALANLLMASWSETREDDLRFMLHRLGNLEQKTGRNEELLQHAVYAGNPGEH